MAYLARGRARLGPRTPIERDISVGTVEARPRLVRLKEVTGLDSELGTRRPKRAPRRAGPAQRAEERAAP
jgi:hypothetical protein